MVDEAHIAAEIANPHFDHALPPCTPPCGVSSIIMRLLSDGTPRQAPGAVVVQSGGLILLEKVYTTS